jgi:hypothetical protein
MAYTYTEIEGSELTATDLKNEWEIASSQDIFTVTAKVQIDDKPEAAQVLFIPSIGRAGVAWGADAQWTDALTLEEAISRFIEDDMTN